MAHTPLVMRPDRRSLALIAGIGLLVCTDVESAPERYRVQATITSSNVAQSADGRMGLSASLTAPRAHAQGSGYSIVASISAPMTCSSEPPLAANDSYTTAENTTLTVNVPGVLGNDSDPEGDPLTAILVSNPTHGTVASSPDGSFVYVPTAGFLGTDSFTYEANDGQLNSNVATVTIKVSHVDQPPVAANDSFTAAENTTLKVAAPGVLANDSDPDGNSLTAVFVSSPANGTLSLNTDGSFVYAPSEAFVGTDTFTYKANDGQTNSNIATVTITVTPGTNDTIFADGFDGV